jgi:hypothetical protein
LIAEHKRKEEERKKRAGAISTGGLK